jgi:hypothetical protein
MPFGTRKVHPNQFKSTRSSCQISLIEVNGKLRYPACLPGVEILQGVALCAIPEYKIRKTQGIDYATCDPYTTPYTESKALQVRRFGLKPNQACRAFDKNLDWGPCTPLGRKFVRLNEVPLI